MVRKLYMIGLGSYVEFRSSREPLQAKICTYLSTKKRKFQLQQTTYLGGRSLGHCPIDELDKLGIPVPGRDAIVTLSPSKAKLVREKRWR